jgi:hypothetical protein
LARALLDSGDDADAVIRRHRPEGPAAAHKVLSHDEVAVRFPPERLKSGPCPVGVLDNEIKAAVAPLSRPLKISGIPPEDRGGRASL